MNKPYLIDIYKGTLRSFMVNGKEIWRIAKPYSEYTLIDRIYHAYLILLGKATAVYFYEDKLNKRIQCGTECVNYNSCDSCTVINRKLEKEIGK